MQNFIWLLAFLPCLHWFGSLVDGAAVLTFPTNVTSIVPPQRLGDTHVIPTGIGIVEKERGAEIPATSAFQSVIWLLSFFLGPEDFYGFIKSQAWSSQDVILGVSVPVKQGTVQRAFLVYGFYFILLLMKQEKDFRSGVFEIQWGGLHVCELLIFPKLSAGLKVEPSFAHVAQLDPPPLSIADSLNNSSQTATNGLGWEIRESLIMPYLIHPMDTLGQLINIVDMLVTLTQPPIDDRVTKPIENNVPNSGVNISLSVAPPDTPQNMTYGFAIWAMYGLTGWVLTTGGQRLQSQMLNWEVPVGEILVVPSPNPSPSTSPLIEAIGNASTDAATAR